LLRPGSPCSPTSNTLCFFGTCTNGVCPCSMRYCHSNSDCCSGTCNNPGALGVCM
jgi:hypothetical protein